MGLIRGFLAQPVDNLALQSRQSHPVCMLTLCESLNFVLLAVSQLIFPSLTPHLLSLNLLCHFPSPPICQSHSCSSNPFYILIPSQSVISTSHLDQFTNQSSTTMSGPRSGCHCVSLPSSCLIVVVAFRCRGTSQLLTTHVTPALDVS